MKAAIIRYFSCGGCTGGVAESNPRVAQSAPSRHQ
jgi:hypothetical protein